MSPLEVFLVGRFTIFVLVLTRTSGLIMTAPLFGSLALPLRVRALLAVSMSLLVTPLHFGTSLGPLENVGDFARLLVNEALVGLLLGLGMNLLFSGIQLAGQIVSQMSGLSLSNVFNPGFDEEVSVFSQLFYFLTLAVFVAIGGHRIITEALLETFLWAPPGHVVMSDGVVDMLNGVMAQSFNLGIRAAAPLLAALLLSTILLGLVSRTMPQINIIAVGFGLNSLLTLALLFLTVGGVAWTFQEPTIDVMQQVMEALERQ